jgi:hypothetical protein
MILKLPYTEYRSEIIRFVKKHHYTRRCTGLWSDAYGILNDAGKLQAVVIYGPAPYPSVARSFVRDQAHINKHIWQSRMVGAGISAEQLDCLIAFAHADLLARGYWWVHTLTDPTEYVIDSPMRIIAKGYTGEVYSRTGALYLGMTKERKLSSFMVDNQHHHVRQGAVTLTLSNVRQHFPDAKSIRAIYTNPKQRWAYVLAETPRERAERTLLMAYHVKPYEMLRQPRLLSKFLDYVVASLVSRKGMPNER